LIIQGNVGIGTTGAGAKLTIVQNGSIYQDVLNVIDTNSDGRPYIKIGMTDSSSGADTGLAVGYDNTNNYGYLSLFGDDPTSGQGVIIKRSGHVGIGDTAPGAKLSVVGNEAIGYSSGQTAPLNGLIIQGNVGIGTTNPATALQVVGIVTASGFAGNGTGITNAVTFSTNAAPTGITWGVTAPDYWIKLTNSMTGGPMWTPCWTNH